MSDACSRCKGKGYVWDGAREKPCWACYGTGAKQLGEHPSILARKAAFDRRPNRGG